jgi:hypothetical protein
MRYLVNQSADIFLTSAYGIPINLDKYWFYNALLDTHNLIGKIMHEIPVDIFSILGMRNLSAFIGELYVVSLANNPLNNGFFIKNPHQDGYPDLLLMDNYGQNLYQQITNAGQLRNKAPFSPFANGGLEIKATFGDVPKPENCFKKWGIEKPDMGDTRIEYLDKFVWKAHHRQTNNLVGLLLDFQNRVPEIVAVFFSNNLTEQDWGNPEHEGEGRTTNVSNMKISGVRKMCQNWILVKNDSRYIDFLNRYNHGVLISSKL